jgi:DNA-binding XRE family transcriptional regulator
MQPEELKALRMNAGLSQAELGELIGMSRVTVGLMERGEARIEKRTELAVRYVVEVLFGEKDA